MSELRRDKIEAMAVPDQEVVGPDEGDLLVVSYRLVRWMPSDPGAAAAAEVEPETTSNEDGGRDELFQRGVFFHATAQSKTVWIVRVCRAAVLRGDSCDKVLVVKCFLIPAIGPDTSGPLYEKRK